MRRMKRWAALALSAALCAGILSGCGKEEAPSILPVSVGNGVTTFDPAYVTTDADNTVALSLYEPLMRMTCDGDGNTTATEGMAKSVDVTENFDGTVVYTFRLRSARWSDGTEVKAQDFVYAWQRLANPLTLSPNAALLSVVQGYDAVRNGGAPEELAVTAKNDTTLEVVLSGKYDWFLTGVCSSPATVPLRQDVVQSLKEKAQAASKTAGEDAAPLKWWYDPTLLVTNGAYHASAYQSGKTLDLTRSEHYYGRVRNDGVRVFFSDSPESAWALYDGETVDLAYALPQEQADAQIAHGQSLTPVLTTHTVLFNGAQYPLDDPSFRKALTLAVDRQAVAALAGSFASAATGLVPYGVPGSAEEDFRSEGGDLLNSSAEDYAGNCEKAKQLLSGSGYDSGASSYVRNSALEYLYVDEGPAAAIATALAEQWRSVLGLRIQPRAVTRAELSDALRTGKYALADVDMSASVNDAETFLAPFSSKSSLNTARYSSGAYDTLLKIIDSASDPAARIACLHDAEVLLLEDAAVSPLYTTGTLWKLREGWSGLCRDPRGWFSFAGVAAVS
ncbi:peptide ABC transporter substrate-binding protein [Oscillibacter sp.]|uniref:peptide ABC transporter substrate-binding protein n=1 Tax=Oscillibacter sp. TaxID=1945593 RepID=UPI00289C5F06|nr:peptide ABC transporter substrate-binding protein [Oscillibacter sp.]